MNSRGWCGAIRVWMVVVVVTVLSDLFRASDFGFRIFAALGAPLALAADALAPTPTQSQKPLAYEEPKRLEGAIYAQGAGTNMLLFRFKRVATRSGSTLDVVRDYTYPDGKLAAREHVIYEGDDLALYELNQTQTGASGSARIRRAEKPGKASIDFTYAAAGEKPKTHNETLGENSLINDMVGPFLLPRWDALMRGEKVKCRYIVVPRRETVGFTFTKASETKWQGREVVILRMEPTSSIIGLLVDPLFFTIEKDPPHRVLQYTGRTTPLAQVGGKWKDLDAVTVFDWN